MTNLELFNQIVKDYSPLPFYHSLHFCTWTARNGHPLNVEIDARFLTLGLRVDSWQTSFLHEIGHIEEGPYEINAWRWAFENASRYGVNIDWNRFEECKNGYLRGAWAEPWKWAPYLDINGYFPKMFEYGSRFNKKL